MINTDFVTSQNIRLIQYSSSGEFELGKQRAIGELLHYERMEEIEKKKVDIEIVELATERWRRNKTLIVKVYSDRTFSPVGGLSKMKGEKEYSTLHVSYQQPLLIADENPMPPLAAIQQERRDYSLFVVKAKKGDLFYWVRIT